MSYIDYLNNFSRIFAQTEYLKTTDRALYDTILDICNRWRWPQPFTLSNERLCTEAKMGEKAMKEGRRRLIRAGALVYSPGGQGAHDCGTYTIIDSSQGVRKRTPCEAREADKGVRQGDPIRGSHKGCKNDPLYIDKGIDKDIEREDTRARGSIYKDPPAEIAGMGTGKPTMQEVQDYIRARGYGVNARLFYSQYESSGWKRGNGVPIVDWRALVDYWEAKDQERRQTDCQGPEDYPKGKDLTNAGSPELIRNIAESLERSKVDAQKARAERIARERGGVDMPKYNTS